MKHITALLDEKLALNAVRNRPALPPEYTYGAPIRSKELCKGDIAYMESTSAMSWAGVSGSPIIKLGPKNVTVESKNRFAPDGPIYTHEHKVPRHVISYVARGRVVHPVILERTRVNALSEGRATQLADPFRRALAVVGLHSRFTKHDIQAELGAGAPTGFYKHFQHWLRTGYIKADDKGLYLTPDGWTWVHGGDRELL